MLDSAARRCAEPDIGMSLAGHGAGEGELRGRAEEAHLIGRLMDSDPRERSVGDVEAIYRAAFAGHG